MSDYDGPTDADPWRNLQPPWKEQGFASFRDWLKAEAEEERRSNPRLRRKHRRDPRLHRGEAPERHVRPGIRSCQVNVRLTDGDMEKLEAAARAYGVAPATMAQMLVNRGLEAVAREDEELGGSSS